MTWIRLECDFPDHESIGTLAEKLRIDPDRAAMSLIRVWCRFGTFQADGMATEITDTTLEDWAKWRGPRGRFALAFREYCVESSGKLAGWWRQEKLLERQERDRKKPGQGSRRKAKGTTEGTQQAPPKAPKRPPGANRVPSGGKSGGNDLNVKGSTGSSTELPFDPPPADAGPNGNWVAHCVDLWRRHAGEPKAGRLGVALTKPFQDIGIERLLVALEAWLKAGNARFGPENFASCYRTFLPDDELINPYDERGDMSPEAAAILRARR